VLMRYRHQTCTIDMWSVGVILLSIMCRRPVLFVSNDDCDALEEISTFMGTQPMRDLADILTRKVQFSEEHPRIPWRNLVARLSKGHTQPRAIWPPELYDLLGRLLELNPAHRLSAAQAANHVFFRVKTTIVHQTVPRSQSVANSVSPTAAHSGSAASSSSSHSQKSTIEFKVGAHYEKGVRDLGLIAALPTDLDWIALQRTVSSPTARQRRQLHREDDRDAADPSSDNGSRNGRNDEVDAPYRRDKHPRRLEPSSDSASASSIVSTARGGHGGFTARHDAPSTSTARLLTKSRATEEGLLYLRQSRQEQILAEQAEQAQRAARENLAYFPHVSIQEACVPFLSQSLLQPSSGVRTRSRSGAAPAMCLIEASNSRIGVLPAPTGQCSSAKTSSTRFNAKDLDRIAQSVAQQLNHLTPLNDDVSMIINHSSHRDSATIETHLIEIVRKEQAATAGKVAAELALLAKNNNLVGDGQR
jgi:serine/threonine protein kinase